MSISDPEALPPLTSLLHNGLSGGKESWRLLEPKHDGFRKASALKALLVRETQNSAGGTATLCGCTQRRSPQHRPYGQGHQVTAHKLAHTARVIERRYVYGKTPP